MNSNDSELIYLCTDPRDKANKAIRRCPSCGSPMLLRASKEGPECSNQFWGCSAFPECKTVAAHG